MSSAKITQTMFYDEYGNNKVALVEVYSDNLEVA